MAGGNLSFDEFMSMPREEQNVRYKDLSDHDKFRARLADVSVKEVFVSCNYCVHYHGFNKCDAYPDKIPRDADDLVLKNPDHKCAGKYRFEHMGHKWSLEFEQNRTGGTGGDNAEKGL